MRDSFRLIYLVPIVIILGIFFFSLQDAGATTFFASRGLSLGESSGLQLDAGEGIQITSEASSDRVVYEITNTGTSGMRSASVSLTGPEIRDLANGGVAFLPAPPAGTWYVGSTLTVLKTNGPDADRLVDGAAGIYLGLTEPTGAIVEDDANLPEYVSHEILYSSGNGLLQPGDYATSQSLLPAANGHQHAWTTPLSIVAYAEPIVDDNINDGDDSKTATEVWADATAGLTAATTVRFTLIYQAITP